MSHPSSQEPLEILLIEDNPGDIRLAEELFQEFEVHTRLSVVRDGEEAIACLRREGRYAATPRPDLILLDLNLPRKGGHEVLAEVKADPDLRRIPVIVLTTSSADRDITRSYELHANCYLTKPVELEAFIAVVESIKGFWLQIVKLPNRGG
jgi:two-component system, chemotaxis family, response regulator Rcp1